MSNYEPEQMQAIRNWRKSQGQEESTIVNSIMQHKHNEN